MTAPSFETEVRAHNFRNEHLCMNYSRNEPIMYISVYAQTQTANAAQDTDSDTRPAAAHTSSRDDGRVVSRCIRVPHYHMWGVCVRHRLREPLRIP